MNDVDLFLAEHDLQEDLHSFEPYSIKKSIVMLISSCKIMTDLCVTMSCNIIISRVLSQP